MRGISLQVDVSQQPAEAENLKFRIWSHYGSDSFAIRFKDKINTHGTCEPLVTSPRPVSLAPQIDNIYPSKVSYCDPQLQFVISGKNFTKATKVLIGNREATFSLPAANKGSVMLVMLDNTNPDQDWKILIR